MLARLETRAMVAALAPLFGKRVRPDEPLARHGTFGVGGPADAFVTIEREDEALALARLAREHGWPLMLVGNGTNVLYADAGARGIVARMAIADWSLEPLDDERTRLVAGAGVNLPKLVNALAARGLAGLEWGAGVPGTVGGAVVSNAGAGGACTGDTLESARALFATAPAGPRVDELAASELELAYRHSRFRAARRVTFGADGAPVAAPRAAIEPPEMIVGASFVLRKDDPEAIRKRVKQHLAYRKETQPTQKSAGSVFKNPPDDYSGRLIEAAGLRGHCYGQAEISAKHANFIINNGGATAAEIVHLIALARRRVRERFGVELELEVELRGEW
ncbi:MAG TPA: UDP-N-acetylmuramate dehydrogenase [Ktedonobacterales bacterium]|nr:UDP-N-acetylmuramate dehydrogenase [Ktedonobacterales bacterium]